MPLIITTKLQCLAFRSVLYRLWELNSICACFGTASISALQMSSFYTGFGNLICAFVGTTRHKFIADQFVLYWL